MARAQTLNVGTNVDINRQTGYQGEESISIDPTNPSRMFAWSNDLSNRNSAAFSTDGGLTWTSRFTGSDGFPALGGDPTSSFDSFGNLYAASFNFNFTNFQIGRSTNGGQTFTVSTVSPVSDQPTIKAGPGSVAGQQSVWLTYLASNSLVARGASSTGLGAFSGFGAALTIPGAGAGNFGDVAIGPGGKVAIAYQTPSSGAGPSNIQLAMNSTGNPAGAFTLAAASISTNVGGFRSIPAQPSRTVDAELGLAYDNSGGPHNGRLYIVYTDAPNTTSNDLNIFTRFSDNDGATWSAPKRVNTDVGTNSQFFSKIALDPATGNIAVAWYDCRNSASNNRVELWGTVSLDGGNTFLPEVKISAGSTTGVGLGGGNELGDYIGLDYYGNVMYPSWADDSNSTGNNPNGTTNLDYYGARVVLSGSRWNINGSGNWSPLGNWIGAGSPNAAGAVGTFGPIISAPATVTLDAPKTAGFINFDSSNSYTIAGANTLTMQAAPANVPAINVISGNHFITVPVVTSSDIQLTAQAAGSSLTLTNFTESAPTAGITVGGSGAVSLNTYRAAGLTITGGAVARVLTNGTSTATSNLKTLTIAGATDAWTSTLDLANNGMVIDYPDLATGSLAVVSNQLKNGYASGAWTGTGIQSSTAAAAAGSTHPTAVGIAEASDLLGPSGGTFMGQTVDGSALLLRYTYVGDANLDGKVDTLDFNSLAANFGGAARTWNQADFNYDGVVDTLDFNNLAANFGQQLAETAPGALVPEPMGLSLMLLAAGAMEGRRRRRR